MSQAFLLLGLPALVALFYSYPACLGLRYARYIFTGGFYNLFVCLFYPVKNILAPTSPPTHTGATLHL